MVKVLKILAITFLVLIILFTVYFVIEDVLGGSPKPVIRELGQFYIDNTYNVGKWWSGSPETVTAILWDYRGLDTIFETTVLYIAIIGCMVLAYKPLANILKKYEKEKHGLTLIVKTTVKIIIVLIAIVSINLALRGYISPGGGFAGGSAYALSLIHI